MKEIEWNKFLFKLYMDFRKSPGWNDLISCHDEEDNRYFKMLEQKGLKPNEFC